MYLSTEIKSNRGATIRPILTYGAEKKEKSKTQEMMETYVLKTVHKAMRKRELFNKCLTKTCDNYSKRKALKNMCLKETITSTVY